MRPSSSRKRIFEIEMSGNSSESRRTTSPMRSILVPLPTVVLTLALPLHEGQPVLADLELVAVLELLVVDPPAVDEGAVQGSLVLDEEMPVALEEHRVVP